METDQAVAKGHGSRLKLLLRGESAVVFTGIALAAILLAVVAATASWNAAALRRSQEEGRTGQIRAVGALLSNSAETMLAADELSALRRLIMDAGRDYDLQQCRVVLPDGGIVADLDPLKITTKALPQTWPPTAEKERTAVIEHGQITLRYPILVQGRGGARMEIAAAVAYPFWAGWEAQTGIGIIGAAGLTALLLVYRNMRNRLRAMGAIRESLLATTGGETGKGALAVSGELGAEAKAWNQILLEKESFRKRMVADRAKETIGAGRESNGDLGAACDAMSQGLVLVDNQMHVKYANGAAAVFLSADRDAMLGQDVSKLILEEQVVEAVRSVACGEIRRRASVEIQRRGESGTVVLRASVRPVRRDDFAAAMILIEDVTQQRVAEEARNAFVAQATHEVRTPLTNIRLYVETAIDDGEEDPTLRASCLNVINQEARRLEHIVGDMLSVSEIEAGSMKMKTDDVRVDALFEDLQRDYQAQADEKKIEMAFSLSPKLPVVQGDREKIGLAVHNLIGNALKYTPEEGKVSVSVDTDGGDLIVEVRDSGIGINEEDQAHVFDKFYRAKDRRVEKITGSGLGLALAREVIRLHGGDIVVESEIDKGSTFTLTLPAQSEEAA